MKLFNKKTLDRYIDKDQPIPEAHRLILGRWVEMIQSGDIRKHNETSLHSEFKGKIIQDVLGYRGAGSGGEYTVASEYPTERGRVDLALGRFGLGGGGRPSKSGSGTERGRHP